MLNLGSTYLIVKDMEKSILFYEALLEMKVSSQNYHRWAQFNLGNACIALWNPKYDEERIAKDDNLEGVYSEEYILYKKRPKLSMGTILF